MSQISVNLLKSQLSITASNDELQEDEAEDIEQHPQNAATVTHLICTNDPHSLKRFLASLRSKEEIRELVNMRDDAGKSPLDLTACLGRVELAKVLIMHGAKIDSATSKGYTCMHHAAAWGKLPVLEVFVENGGNYHRRNIHGETPMDIAIRYNQFGCAQFLELTEETKKLQAEITNTLEKIKDDKLIGGRITKDEKGDDGDDDDFSKDDPYILDQLLLHVLA